MIGSKSRRPAAAPLAQELKRFASKLRRRLREQADAGDLTPSQTATLLRLEKDGPATTSALARAEGMRPQSMGTIVATLQLAGLVGSTPDPVDGRQTIIAITDACRTWLEQARAARHDWLARTIEAELSPAERVRLAAVMPLLRRLVGE